MVQRILFALVATTALLSSCVNDFDDNPGTEGGEGIPVTISLNTLVDGTLSGAVTRAGYHNEDGDLNDGGTNTDSDPGYADGDPLDSRITHLRILMYDSRTGRLMQNLAFDMTSNTFPLTVDVLTGTYDFHFIANGNGTSAAPGPSADENIAQVLPDDAKINLLAKLEKMKVHGGVYSSSADIPMYRRVSGVKIVGDNHLILPDGTDTSKSQDRIWYQAIERTGVRVSMEIVLSSYQYTQWTSIASTPGAKDIQIGDVPKWTGLMPGMDNHASRTGAASNLVVAASEVSDAENPIRFLDKDGNEVSVLDPAGSVRVRFDRIILPELVLNDKTDADEAYVLSMKIGSNVKSGKMSVPFPEASPDYALPRNTWLHLDVSVENDELLVVPRVVEWNDAVQDVLVAGEYFLEVDRNELIYMAAGGTQTVNIRTNAPGGWTLNQSSTEFVHSDKLAGLQGETTSVSVTADPLTGGQAHESRILVTALDGRLHKEIAVRRLPDTDSPSPANVNMYVGAFWKNHQTGERLIRIARPTTGALDGPWSATVVEGQDWIVLDRMMTDDENVGWRTGANETGVHNGNDAGFDAEHSVNSEATYIESTLTPQTPEKGIYFRIGLKSEYTPTVDKPARYGLVVLNYSSDGGELNSYRRIFIRQGEDPDYLIPNGEAATGNRTASVMFSPYNLTVKTDAEKDALDRNGWAQLPVGGGAFTDYPTRAGALFQFGSTTRRNYAFNPGKPLSEWSIQWNDNSGTDFDPATMETCPDGYRRPAIKGHGEAFLSQNETTQSLWETPALNSNVDNLVFGYYADGYFDRRSINTSFRQDYFAANATVSQNTTDVANVGALMFNAIQGSRRYGASIFLPASGNIAGVSDHVNVGYNSFYWSDTKGNDGYADGGLIMWIGKLTSGNYIQGYSSGSTSYGSGLAIRCVVDPASAPKTRIQAPPGMLGVRESNGELTLLGSNVYDGVAANGGNPEVKGTAGERVALMYFKRGSVIGVYGDSEGDDFDASDVAWTPTAAQLTAVKTAIGSKTGAAAWAVIDNWEEDDYYPENSSTNLEAGFGDPCPFGETAEGIQWQMPTEDYLSNLDLQFDNDALMVETIVNGMPGRQYRNAPEWFFPYAGMRASDFMATELGGGNYAAGDVLLYREVYLSQYKAPNDYAVAWIYGGPDDHEVLPGAGMDNIDDLDFAGIVRCVPEPETGFLASPGVIGYIKGTNTLTLRGSKEYAGTPVATRADGKGTDEFGDLEDETVYIANFKFGSLIATKYIYDYSTFTDDYIVAAPKEYENSGSAAAALAAIKADIRAVAPDPNPDSPIARDTKWLALPVSPVIPGESAMISTPESWAQGVGDPCRVWFGEEWRTPAGPVWNNDGGTPFGSSSVTDYYSSWTVTTSGPGNGAMWIDSLTAISLRLPMRGAVAGDGAGGQDWSMFLPATEGGMVSSSYGDFYRSYEGTYWSSMISFANAAYHPEGSYAHNLYFNNYSLAPDQTSGNSSLNNARGVRCVPASPAESAVKGIRAVPGVIGYYANGKNQGRLTLDGDNGDNEDIVYMAYFKWGSLVATSSQNTGAFSSADVVAADGFDGNTNPASALAAMKTTLDSGTSTAQAKWDKIPYADLDGRNKGAQPVWPETTPANIAAGIGDACRHYFRAEYKTPSKQDNADFTGPFSNGVSSGNDGVNYRWTANGGNVTDPGVGTLLKSPLGATTSLPGAGYRNTTGTVTNQGTMGRYWSTDMTLATNWKAEFLGIFNYGLYLAQNDDFAIANPIRCVHIVS